MDPIRSSDEEAEDWLRSTHKQYSQSLFRYALTLTCSVDDAQDAVQEVFGRVSGERQLMTEVRDIRAYLFKATRNAAFSVLRKRQRSQALHDAICADLASVCAPQTRQLSATIIAIRGAFSHLSTEQREVLVLKILDQLTFREIAQATGAPINTVFGRYRYGIEKLRRALGADFRET